MTAAESDQQDLAIALRATGAALAAGEGPRAIALARAAVKRGLKDAMFHNLIAHDLQEEGRLDEAMAELQRAYELAPRDVLILNAIGRCLVRQDRLADALKVYDAALSVEPGFATSHLNKGDVLALLRDFDAARASIRRALELAPEDAAALASMASLELRRGVTAAAESLSRRALELDAGQMTAVLTLAEVEIGQDEASAAEARLRSLLAGRLPPVIRPQAESLLGDALDAQGRFDEAFAAYAAASGEFARLHAGRYARPGAPTVLEMASWLLGRFEAADPADWKPTPAAPRDADPRQHIFFVGFPRSGTTLLEQILASHPGIVTLDERPALADATTGLFTSNAKLDRLARLSGAEAEGWREDYWRRVAEYCPEVAGRVFIDKLPLNSVLLGLIVKLFPNAKVLFAVRDPRDVVLSCFRRRFDMNPAMYQLVTLEGAATYYDAVMSLVAQYTAKLPLDINHVRYETLVGDLKGAVEDVCAFIGAPWDDAMLAFPEAARGREIRTPSAAQVRRGLYREGAGQWRPYAQHLAAVMPLLSRWVEHFAYPAD